jgi:hypothetical protein
MLNEQDREWIYSIHLDRKQIGFTFLFVSFFN